MACAGNRNTVNIGYNDLKQMLIAERLKGLLLGASEMYIEKMDYTFLLSIIHAEDYEIATRVIKSSRRPSNEKFCEAALMYIENA